MKAVYVLLLIAITLAIENPTPGKKVLVIIENNGLKVTHSKFFENLKNKGCELEYTMVTESFEISKYGEFLYDHIVLMLETDKKYNNLKFREFQSFLDFHGDIFVMFGSSPNDFVRKIAGYAGIEVDAAGSTVVDHFTAVTGSDNIHHTKFTTSGYAKISRMVGELATRTGSITYKGMGMRVNANNVLTIPVLTGDVATTALSANNSPLGYSTDVVLVAASQTRSNNRFVIAASTQMFSNAYYTENADNQLFGNQLSLWTFKFFGYLRVRNIEHYKYIREEDRIEKEHEILVQAVKKPNLPASHFPEPEVAGNNVVYRVKQELYYSVNIQEFDGEEWKPYEADDVQLEFVMLDPYIRKTLTYKQDGEYSTILRAPDVYGIYKFRLFYQRQGLSLINENTQVSIRPFKHNEFPRFILAAYPYYTSAIVLMIGFVVFVWIFLFAGEKQKQD